MDKFFRQFVQSKNPKKETANNYVIIFFLSLEHFAPQCFEVEALRTILHKESSRGIFEHWWTIRDTILLINNMSGDTAAELNSYLLSKSEVLVLIERVRNNQDILQEVEAWINKCEKDIKEWRKEVRSGNQLRRAKLEKYEKNFKIGSGKTRSSPVALKLLEYFIKEEEVDPVHAVRNSEPH